MVKSVAMIMFFFMVMIIMAVFMDMIVDYHVFLISKLFNHFYNTPMNLFFINYEQELLVGPHPTKEVVSSYVSLFNRYFLPLLYTAFYGIVSTICMYNSVYLC